MGDDERTEAILDIADKLYIRLDDLGIVESHADYVLYSNICSKLAEVVYEREIGYQSILAAIISGDITINCSSLSPNVIIPRGAIMRAKLPIQITEEPDKNVIIIRRKS